VSLAGVEVEAGLVAAGVIFWYSCDLCRYAEGASMGGGRTTGYRRRVRGAEIGVHIVRFVFGIINAAGSAGSASIRAVRAVRIHR
jgi:hypothetical protein